MRVVIAPDKFKGTLTAAKAARAMATGWAGGDPAAEIEQLPVADGGDGTLDVLVSALGGRREWVRVTGPLGDPVEADFGLVETRTGRTAIVEMARASGLNLLADGRRDALRATTFGTGELILASARHRPTRIIVCIGGSATTDGGAGMAQALGVRLLDETGRDLRPGGAALRGLAAIDATEVPADLRNADVVVATDVDNPLTGPTGAAAIYGPQKGASPADVANLDEGLRHLAAVVHRDLGIDVREMPGSGAAGGLGAGLVAFLGARLRSGFDTVSETLELARHVEGAGVAVTGEGFFDQQTAHGKAPAGVLRLAREAGVRSVVIAGQVEPAMKSAADIVLSLSERAGSVHVAMERAEDLLREAAADAAERMRREP
jgi:glycerate kinase